jgi:6-phosphogluconolactonase
MQMLLSAVLCGLVSFVAIAYGGQSDRRIPAATAFYVGTYTDGASKGIYRLELNPESGRLSDPALVAEAVNPSFLAWHPSRDVIYAVSETNTNGPRKAGAVMAFRVTAGGKLEKINEQTSGGAHPCYVSVNAEATHVFVANYSGGSVAAFPLQADGGIGEASALVKHKGSSVHAARQRQPHAHAILPVRGSPFVLAADLGIDRVLVYRFDRSRGSLTPHEPAGVGTTPGAGPRHLALSPSGDTLFVINELQSTVASYAWDVNAGTLRPSVAVSTLPDGFTGSNTTAEVTVHPNGRFVYGSNRGHDSIAVFRVNGDRTLTRVGTYPTDGRQPRHFAIDPTGTFLLAANQKSDSIVVFRVDQETGALTNTGVSARVPTPVCVRFKPSTP